MKIGSKMGKKRKPYSLEYRNSRKREGNPNWKGDARKYNALHTRMHKIIERPILCHICKQEKKLELCNKSQNYLDDINDWFFACHSCHIKYDLTPEKIINLVSRFKKYEKT